jgi:hypothetical protein
MGDVGTHDRPRNDRTPPAARARGDQGLHIFWGGTRRNTNRPVYDARMERVPQSVEVRELESPTLMNGDTLHVTSTVTIDSDGPWPRPMELEWDKVRDVWVSRADGALEHYPDAFG